MHTVARFEPQNVSGFDAPIFDFRQDLLAHVIALQVMNGTFAAFLQEALISMLTQFTAAEHVIHTLFCCHLLYAKSHIELVKLNDGVTNLAAVCLHEGVSHTTTKNQLVYLAEKVLDDTYLRRNLRTT